MTSFGEKVVLSKTLKEGFITDGFVTSLGKMVYEVELESGEKIYCEEREILNKQESAFHIEVDHADNVIIVRLLDANDNEVARGHGHIIHDGALGIAQAVSYASRRLLYVLDDQQPEGQRIYAKGENNYGFNTVRKNSQTHERPRFHHCARSCE